MRNTLSHTFFLMARLILQGNAVESIAWLEKPKHEKDISIRRALSMTVRGRRAHWIRAGIIAPISLAGIMLYRGSGLRDLMRGMMAQAGDTEGLAAAAVVQFSDAAKVRTTN